MQHAPVALQLLFVSQLSQPILILDPLGSRFGFLHCGGESADGFERGQLEAGDSSQAGSRRTEWSVADGEDECRREHVLRSAYFTKGRYLCSGVMEGGLGRWVQVYLHVVPRSVFAFRFPASWTRHFGRSDKHTCDSPNLAGARDPVRVDDNSLGLSWDWTTSSWHSDRLLRTY